MSEENEDLENINCRVYFPFWEKQIFAKSICQFKAALQKNVSSFLCPHATLLTLLEQVYFHINQFSDNRWISYNYVTILPTLGWHQISQIKGLVPQGYSYFRCQSRDPTIPGTSDRPIVNPGSHYIIQVQINSLMKRYTGHGMWKGYRASMTSLGMPIFQHFHVFGNPEAP